VEASKDQRQGAFKRAWHDTNLWSTETLAALAIFVVCGGIGGMVAAEHAEKPEVVYVIGPLAGVIAGAALVLLAHLLFALKIQRDELRDLLESSAESTTTDESAGDTYVFHEGSNPVFRYEQGREEEGRTRRPRAD
jgi:hypothetical protein